MAVNALLQLNEHYSTAAKLAEIAVAPSHALDVLSEKPTPINLFAATNAVMHKVRRTYKYKLYRSRRNRKLHRQINAAALAHNHIIALHRRYYGLFKKSISLYTVQEHLTKIKHLPRFAYMLEIGSQSLQEVAARIDRAYKRFFDNLKERNQHKTTREVGRPKFKKVAKYKSFTLKQAGWKLDEAHSTLVINGQKYRYHNSRPLPSSANIKTVTVKRDGLNDLYVFFSVVVEVPEVMARTGKSVGVDFGLKTFITASDWNDVESPLFFKQNRTALKQADRNLSRKLLGSHNRRKAKRARAKIYRHVEDCRRDWFFKLAWELCGRYALICVEDLSLDGMKRFNGGKVSDEAFGEFLQVLEHVAKQCGTTIQQVSRWFPSTQLCSECGYQNKALAGKKALGVREWDCPECGAHHDRDHNAAVNILHEGERLFKEKLS